MNNNCFIKDELLHDFKGNYYENYRLNYGKSERNKLLVEWIKNFGKPVDIKNFYKAYLVTAEQLRKNSKSLTLGFISGIAGVALFLELVWFVIYLFFVLSARSMVFPAETVVLNVIVIFLTYGFYKNFKTSKIGNNVDLIISVQDENENFKHYLINSNLAATIYDNSVGE